MKFIELLLIPSSQQIKPNKRMKDEVPLESNSHCIYINLEYLPMTTVCSVQYTIMLGLEVNQREGFFRTHIDVAEPALIWR